MIKGSLMGEYAPRTKVGGLKKKVNKIFQSLNSIKINRDRGSLWVGAVASMKTVGLVLAATIVLLLLIGADLSMASILSPPFSWTDTEKNEKMLGTVWLELYGPDELPSEYSGTKYYRLRITFPPVTKRGYDGDFKMLKISGAVFSPKAGRGMFLDLSKPGLIMLAIEDDKAYFVGSGQKLYFKEVEWDKASWTKQPIEKVYTGHDNLGVPLHHANP